MRPELNHILKTNWWHFPYLKTRLVVKSVLWSRPKLYWPVGFIQRQPWLFSKNYDILVDGFQRSANSFSAEAVRLTQPNIKVLSHRHMPVYAIQALKFKKPICITIRDPIEAIASWVLFSGITIAFAIEDYIAYYNPLLEYKSNFVVAEFNSIINHFPDIVGELNSKFELRYDVPDWNESVKNAIFDRVREYPWSGNPLRASIPTEERALLSRSIKLQLQSGAYDEKLSRAYSLYNNFTTH